MCQAAIGLMYDCISWLVLIVLAGAVHQALLPCYVMLTVSTDALSALSQFDNWICLEIPLLYSLRLDLSLLVGVPNIMQQIFDLARIGSEVQTNMSHPEFSHGGIVRNLATSRPWLFR